MTQSDRLTLRALEPEDTDLLYRWENDSANAVLGNSPVPYSKAVLRGFIEGSTDIFTDKQLRLMIELNSDGSPIGCVDLFDFDFIHGRAGIGILIADLQDREQGYASEAIELLCAYAFERLKLNQLYCHVMESNEASIGLFEKAGFSLSGTRKAWLKTNSGFASERFYQKFNPNLTF